jgi:two-component system, response regulator RegA
MAMLLRTRGIPAYEAATAEDAIHFLEEGQCPLPSHAVVDVDLPGMCGLDLVRRMAETVPQVQPVLVTGADSRLVEAFRRSYPVRYFAKPVNVHGFLGAMIQMVKDQHPM